MGTPSVSVRHSLCFSEGGQKPALADFLAAHPVPENSKLLEDIPDEVFESNITSMDEVWQMFFNGA